MNHPEFFQISFLPFLNDRGLITRTENMICALFFNIFPKEKKKLKKECSINLKIQIILNFKRFLVLSPDFDFFF